MFSLRGIVSLVLYLVIIPTVTTALDRKWKLRSSIRDLTLSQWSVILLSLGSFLIAFAPRFWVLVVGFTIALLGTGASITLRAFLAAKVDPADYGIRLLLGNKS